MKPERKIKIAESFSNKYAETELDIYLSQKEFELLDRGIFAGSMDEKWNIFIHNDSLFFARSWTDNCIYKADLETKRRGIKLNKLKITRNTITSSQILKWKKRWNPFLQLSNQKSRGFPTTSQPRTTSKNC